MAIQAYVDESGCDGRSPVFVFSALIAEAEQWAAFADHWNFVLHEPPGIRHFKMAEAAKRGGEFYGFSKTERNEKIKRLCKVINAARPTEISCSVELSKFAPAIKYFYESPLNQPYFLPFQIIIVTVAYEMLTRGETEPFEIFFDRNEMFGPESRMWYPIICSTLDESIKPVMPVEPLFRSDGDVLPLQAADLIAWITRKEKSDGLGEFEWLPKELSGLKRSPLSQISSQELAVLVQDRIIPQTPEAKEKRDATLRAYRKTFGKDWNHPKIKRSSGK